jgi:hypothetical protein
MQTNTLPFYDQSNNPTLCCAKFKPQGWDDVSLHFENKLFVKAETLSFIYLPINIGWVFRKTFNAIEDANALDNDDLIVLSYTASPWRSEHYFSVGKEVPGQTMVRLTGDYITKVFEGPYKLAPKWEETMKNCAESTGKRLVKNYFFYTTCPQCAKYYQKNYVVAVAQIE